MKKSQFANYSILSLITTVYFFSITLCSSADIRRFDVSIPSGAGGFSSPLIADIDNNKENGLEIVKSSADGSVHAVSSSGQLLWSTTIPSIDCVGQVGNRVHSSPAIGKLNNSGEKSIVIGFGAVISRSCDGGVIALNARTGALEWKFSLKEFSRKQKFWAFRYSVFSTPALADTNGDGLMEIGFGAFDRNVYLLNPNGRARWYYQAADTVWSSPLFLDTNGDNVKELVAATDISANKRLKPATPDGGYLYSMSTASRKSLLVPFRDSKNNLWRSETDQTLYSSPIAADVLPSNPGKEIIIASGCFFPTSNNNKRGRWIKIFDEKSGKLLKTLETPACSASSPAAGDLNDDGVPEVIGFIQGAGRNGGNGQSHVIAWNAESGQQLWNVVPLARGSNNEIGGEYASPVIADLDGNGSLEVIVINGSGVTILDGKNGAHLSCEGRSCDGKPNLNMGSSTSTAAVGDLDGDGALELVASASDGLHVWSGFNGQLGSSPGSQTAYSAPWPMWRGNPQRSGVN